MFSIDKEGILTVTGSYNNVQIEFTKSDKEKDTVIEQIGSGTIKRKSLMKLLQIIVIQ